MSDFKLSISLNGLAAVLCWFLVLQGHTISSNWFFHCNSCSLRGNNKVLHVAELGHLDFVKTVMGIRHVIGKAHMCLLPLIFPAGEDDNLMPNASLIEQERHHFL
ncbi:hypothetical protein DSO57_1010862 [Entomophthora muscae]|uniref:Uncharacterized protein n=1 Tax=Entomophthora muscae TaxID=34485 RepID=A0ACC2TU01_9FUNG|nr:hypothetical protein DSO57_1010862 [Entomophthora muscae]